MRSRLEKISLLAFCVAYGFLTFLNVGGNVPLSHVFEPGIDFGYGGDIQKILAGSVSIETGVRDALVFALPVISAVLVRNLFINCGFLAYTLFNLYLWWNSLTRLISNPTHAVRATGGVRSETIFLIPILLAALLVLLGWLLIVAAPYLWSHLRPKRP